MNSFIFKIFKIIIDYVLYYSNIVEYIKMFTRFTYNKLGCKNISNEELRRVSLFAIDIFILFKWALLIYFWSNHINTDISKYIIYYLIYSNLFTYFYYHSWGSKYSQNSNPEAMKKNFINYLLAIAYYLACYAYLYQIHFINMIKIESDYFDVQVLDYINAIYLSISTAFTLTYSGIQPLTQEIRIIFLSELINSFLFFTIIISNSVPITFKQGENN